jgi:U32 family peptidase
MDPEWVEEIRKAANRPLHTGFYFDEPAAGGHIYGPEDNGPAVDFAGVVLDYDEATGTALIEQRNYFRPGQTIEFFGPEGFKFTQVAGELSDTEGVRLEAARHPLQAVRLKVDRPLRKMDMMRRWSS